MNNNPMNMIDIFTQLSDQNKVLLIQLAQKLREKQWENEVDYLFFDLTAGHDEEGNGNGPVNH